MLETKTKLQRIAGICGIFTPFIAFTFIFLAIAFYPPFSWTNNALSDLGIVTGVTSVLFNAGLIISGVLAFIFAIGLFLTFSKNTLGLMGAFVFALASISLILIGLFPELVEPTHYMVSVAFFVLLPISLLIMTGAYVAMHKARIAVFTLFVALVAAFSWVLYFFIQYAPGVAIPELVSGLAGTVWAVVLGYRMLK